MRIALDISPISNSKKIAHRVRGTGSYVNHLKKYLPKYYPDNTYIFYNFLSEVPRDVDVIHIPYFEPFFFSLPFFKKHKTIVTVHDLTPFVFPDHFPSGIKGAVRWNIQKLLLKNTDMIVVDSECSKKDVVKHANIDEGKIEVIYPAAGEEFKKIDASSVQANTLRKKYNLPEKFVLYVGDATWNKNLPRLLEAFKKLSFKLVMVGSALKKTDIDINNPWNSDLLTAQKLIEQNKNIISLGFIPTEDLVLLYNLATLCVMPSLYEGFGLPILEAMNCGCPVVTTKVGSIEEIAVDSAYYVDPYNTDSIKDGILTVFSDQKLRSELSKKGLLRDKEFTWKKTVDKLIKVYERKNTASH